jgi:hypothetical protein
VSRANLAWKVVAVVAGAASGLVARRLVRSLWKGAKHGQAPPDPRSPSASWKEAIALAAATGLAAAVVRLVVQRAAAAAWKAKTGSYPPAVEKAS